MEMLQGFADIEGGMVDSLENLALAPSRLSLAVGPIESKEAACLVVEKHYLHRRPSISFAFGLYEGAELVGVCTFGCPPSRHLQKSACPSNPSLVVELNRLWCSDDLPRNTESWFIARALRQMPPRIVVSYADTAYGHIGYIYRASNWNYAGWTDMERKTPRYDYVVEGKHTRDAFRCHKFKRVRRKPKHKYWTLTGDRRERREIGRLVGWPRLSWKPHLVEAG